jgi:hypothetical protein
MTKLTYTALFGFGFLSLFAPAVFASAPVS